jgi:hypothetical protein
MKTTTDMCFWEGACVLVCARVRKANPECADTHKVVSLDRGRGGSELPETLCQAAHCVIYSLIYMTGWVLTLLPSSE